MTFSFSKSLIAGNSALKIEDPSVFSCFTICSYISQGISQITPPGWEAFECIWKKEH